MTKFKCIKDTYPTQGQGTNIFKNDVLEFRSISNDKELITFKGISEIYNSKDFKLIEKLVTFPKTGYCLNDKDGKLYDYLVSNKYLNDCKGIPYNCYIAWNDAKFWTVNVTSNRPLYLIEELPIDKVEESEYIKSKDNDNLIISINPDDAIPTNTLNSTVLTKDITEARDFAEYMYITAGRGVSKTNSMIAYQQELINNFKNQRDEQSRRNTSRSERRCNESSERIYYKGSARKTNVPTTKTEESDRDRLRKPNVGRRRK